MKIIQTINEMLINKKFNNLKTYKINNRNYLFDYAIVSSGMSLRHNMIAGCDVYSEIKNLANQNDIRFNLSLNDKDDRWVSIEVDDIIFHIMSDEARDYYQIDNFYQEFGSLVS
jgi:ribosome-associated protein